jgi:KUP system potassium uptake protein
MVITMVLAFFVSIRKWKWHAVTAGLVALFFLTVDLAFFGANMLKIKSGGWFPLVAGVAVFSLMTTWRRGREILHERLGGGTEFLKDFIDSLADAPPHRVPGVAVFMSSSFVGTPTMLHHHLAHNQVLHDQVIILTVLTEEIPRVPASERVSVTKMPKGFARVIVRYGFMQSPNVPVALRQCEALGLAVDLVHTTFYLSRETIISTARRSGMMRWQEKLFSFMTRNSLTATAFFNIPAEQVVELGQYVEI